MGSEQARVQARSWWWTAAAVVTVVGWVGALLTTAPSALIASTVVFAAFALLVSTGVQTSPENRGRAQGTVNPDWRRLVDHTLAGTGGGIAALGLLQVSVAAALLVGLALGVTAPWALSWHLNGVPKQASGGRVPGGRGEDVYRSATTRSPNVPETVAEAVAETAEAGVELGPVTPAPELGTMPTTELVLAWRRSYAQLMRVRSPQQLAALAARRQQLLDELERRDAAGVARWLRSGARAASDPSRFLQRPTGPSATSA